MLRHIADGSAADWLDLSPAGWSDTVGFGPAGFEAYARLRFIPAPEYHGQRENDHDPDPPEDVEALRPVIETLAWFTTTPDDAYFCLWEGWGLGGMTDVNPDGTMTPRPAAFPREILDHPGVVGCARAYLLFRGPLADLGQWGATPSQPGWPPPDPPPAFVWPADRAWCVARDVDPHWAGIGGSAEAVAAVCALPDRDVVPARRGEDVPEYR